MKLSKKVKEKFLEARKDLVETDGTIAYILNRYLDRELVEILTVEELRDEFVKVVQSHIDELRNPDDFTKMVAILNSITNEIKLLSTLGTYLTGEKVLKTESLLMSENLTSEEYAKEAWLMNKVISSINDEEAYYGSWIYDWPDGLDEEDVVEYFGDKDSFEDLKETFIDTYKIYHDEGLFDPDEETIEYAKRWDKELGLEPIEIIRKEKKIMEDINYTSPTIEKLEKELEKTKTRLAKDFKEGSLASMKKAEIALQDVIEKVYPKTVWWRVTNYWDIFNAFMVGNDLDTVIETIIEKAKAYEKNGEKDEKLTERKRMKEDSEDTSMCHRLNNYVRKSKMEEKTVRANRKTLKESGKSEFLVSWEQVYEDAEFNSKYFNTLEEAKRFIEKYADYGNMRNWSLAEVDPADDYKIVKEYEVDESLNRKNLHENLKAIKKGNKSFSKKESDKLVENIQRYMFDLNKYYGLYTGKVNDNKYAPTCIYEAKEDKQKEFQKYLESYIARKDNTLRVLKEKVEESELDGYPVYNYTIIKK